ncbi:MULTISPECIES: shikimate kinase [unclassified Campylobacter]|uniref:shikimate kinase n=1 Tax=unclassified Campylobacter TaxID=2593542 RepID=UPI001237BE97|nr:MULTISPECIES: shikimate kinase [unclassified Campylobacter]KAA6226406.1 shikimate kinase [Campylobacter sp. LR286c]KAA6226556.1 shikimate kinase [Campylobacter sp. LR185c]KAA6226894.1 shikimate kinase [Campylobacter sp. LR196d]KAA6230335.1 shikimate kinase [Campylobacter sp. LR291e]KAA8603637.1 shikimate kinase [Campylobacter sp. LR185c]
MIDKNIFFVGFMGCGKSTIAREFALNENLIFLDSDQLISLQFNLSIKEIFEKFGETFFRKEEEKMARFFGDIKGASIATGGGFINANNLDRIGLCVYLKAEFEYLKNRLNKEEIAKRPLFFDENKAKKLYNERLNLYKKKANLIMDITNKSVKDIVKELQEKIK